MNEGAYSRYYDFLLILEEYQDKSLAIYTVKSERKDKIEREKKRRRDKIEQEKKKRRDKIEQEKKRRQDYIEQEKKRRRDYVENEKKKRLQEIEVISSQRQRELDQRASAEAEQIRTEKEAYVKKCTSVITILDGYLKSMSRFRMNKTEGEAALYELGDIQKRFRMLSGRDYDPNTERLYRDITGMIRYYKNQISNAEKSAERKIEALNTTADISDLNLDISDLVYDDSDLVYDDSDLVYDDSDLVYDDSDLVYDDSDLVVPDESELFSEPQCDAMIQAIKSQTPEFENIRASFTDGSGIRQTAESISPFYCKLPIYLSMKSKRMLKQLLGSSYEPRLDMIRIPLAVSTDRIIHVNVELDDDRDSENKIHDHIGVFLEAVLYSFPSVKNRVVFLDGLSHNADNWPVLKDLEQQDGFVWLPEDSGEEEEALETLTRLNPVRNDKDEIRFLVVYGDESCFSLKTSALIKDICYNELSRRICVITINKRREYSDRRWPEGTDVIQLSYEEGSGYWVDGEKNIQLEAWDPAPLDTETVKAIRKVYEPKQASNRYFEVCPLPAGIPERHTGEERKEIRLPFANTEEGALFSAVFGGENSFGFLMGSTGSGKTSLLHILISDLITQYHPDDMELWLVDFKTTEFEYYREHRPPHVRYILMDETQTYTFSLVQMMADEVRRRKEKFIEYGLQSDISEIDEKRYFPNLFIIIDEFGVLAKAIENSIHYMEELAYVLTQGRYVGVRCLFASQSFREARSGLNGEARTQIGMSMVMRANQIELELDTIDEHWDPAVRKRAAKLPAFSMLYSSWNKEGKESHFLRNLWFAKPQDMDRICEYITWMNDNMIAVKEEDYREGRPDHYVDKKAVIVKSGKEVSIHTVLPEIREVVQESQMKWDYSKGDLLLFPGNPVSLERLHGISLRAKSKENMALFAHTETQMQELASLVHALCLTAEVNNASVEIWTAEDNLCVKWLQVNGLQDTVSVYFISRGCRGNLPGHCAETADEVSDYVQKPKLILILDIAAVLANTRPVSRWRGSQPLKTAPEEMPMDLMTPNAFFEKFQAGIADVVSGTQKAMPQNSEDGELVKSALKFLLEEGPIQGCHFVIQGEKASDYDALGLPMRDAFSHLAAFRLASDSGAYRCPFDTAALEKLPQGFVGVTNGMNTSLFRVFK